VLLRAILSPSLEVLTRFRYVDYRPGGPRNDSDCNYRDCGQECTFGVIAPGLRATLPELGMMEGLPTIQALLVNKSH
jgi:hypothetical protein